MPTLGLIGLSLDHSFSPAYFKKKFKELALNKYEYKLFPLSRIEDFPQLIADHPDIIALHVTIPYKSAVLQHVNITSDEVKTIGAANLLLLERQESLHFSAHNTDVFGFSESLKNWLNHPINKALVLGNGGASKAVQVALKQMGIAYQVASRNSSFLFSQVDLSDYDLIINCTPVGTLSKTPLNEASKLPLLFEQIKPNTYFYDLVYNPAETDMMKEAARFGAQVKNGLEMLHLQADRSWDIIKNAFPIL